MPLLLPTRTFRFGPVFTRATPPGFGSTAGRSAKKSLRDFATLANLGHFALRSAWEGEAAEKECLLLNPDQRSE